MRAIIVLKFFQAHMLTRSDSASCGQNDMKKQLHKSSEWTNLINSNLIFKFQRILFPSLRLFLLEKTLLIGYKN